MFVRFGGIDYDDDADAIAKLDDFIRRAQRILATYGGNVLNMTLGDKGAYLASVVGAPQAHEDDAARAASAALELRDLESATAVTDIQIGITYGRLRSGTYGHRRRQAFTCLGNAVNLSARLMAKAPPGQIYVAEPVRHAAGDTFDWEQLPPLTVKGRAEPVSVFALAGSKRRASRRQASFDLPMVGRQAEIDTLAAKLDEALAGRGQIVGISAEAGMGKSRLVAEFARTVEPRGITVAVGECQSFGRNTSYLVWNAIWSVAVSPRQPPGGGRAGAIAGGGAGGDRPCAGAAGAAARRTSRLAHSRQRPHRVVRCEAAQDLARGTPRRLPPGAGEQSADPAGARGLLLDRSVVARSPRGAWPRAGRCQCSARARVPSGQGRRQQSGRREPAALRRDRADRARGTARGAADPVETCADAGGGSGSSGGARRPHHRPRAGESVLHRGTAQLHPQPGRGSAGRVGDQQARAPREPEQPDPEPDRHAGRSTAADAQGRERAWDARSGRRRCRASTPSSGPWTRSRIICERSVRTTSSSSKRKP